MTPEVITQTALRSFRKCQRFYNLNYVQLYRAAKDADPLVFGTIWHRIRAAWWSAGPDARFQAATNAWSSYSVDLDIFVRAKMMAMLQGYHFRWLEYVNSMQIIGVEVPYTIPLFNPRTGHESRAFVVSGQLDAVVRLAGDLWVVEEKTAADSLSPDSPYWRRLEMDPQCSLYYTALWKMYNERPRGVLYFVCAKPSQRPLKATQDVKYKKDGEPKAGQRLTDETSSEYLKRITEKIAEDPNNYYHLREVPRLEQTVRESMIDVWDTAQAIRRAQKNDTWLRNPDACVHPFGPTCTYLPVCANRASITDPTLYRKAETAHEELTKAP